MTGMFGRTKGDGFNSGHLLVVSKNKTRLLLDRRVFAQIAESKLLRTLPHHWFLQTGRNSSDAKLNPGSSTGRI